MLSPTNLQSKQPVSQAAEVKPEIDMLTANQLIQENLKHTQEILAAVKDTQHNIKLLQLWGLFRFLIIIIPLVLGFIYLPPLIREIASSYRSLFY